MSRAHPECVAIVVAAMCLSMAGASRGDALPAPPPSCPPGSEGASCHGPPHCAPLECRDDAQCTDGATCQDLRLCMGVVYCGSRGQSHPRRVVIGSCPSGESCGEDPCLTVRVCVPPAPPPAPTAPSAPPAPAEEGSGSSCGGCAVVSGADAPGTPVGVALGAIVLNALCLFAARRSC